MSLLASTLGACTYPPSNFIRTESPFFFLNPKCQSKGRLRSAPNGVLPSGQCWDDPFSISPVIWVLGSLGFCPP